MTYDSCYISGFNYASGVSSSFIRDLTIYCAVKRLKRIVFLKGLVNSLLFQCFGKENTKIRNRNKEKTLKGKYHGHLVLHQKLQNVFFFIKRNLKILLKFIVNYHPSVL